MSATIIHTSTEFTSCARSQFVISGVGLTVVAVRADVGTVRSQGAVRASRTGNAVSLEAFSPRFVVFTTSARGLTRVHRAGFADITRFALDWHSGVSSAPIECSSLRASETCGTRGAVIVLHNSVRCSESSRRAWEFLGISRPSRVQVTQLRGDIVGFSPSCGDFAHSNVNTIPGVGGRRSGSNGARRTFLGEGRAGRAEMVVRAGRSSDR